MFACLHGQGNLTALAFEFSPTVERTAGDTVTFEVSGMERLFGPPQDIARAIARRAAELQVKANLALAMNPDAAICAARGFSGTSIIPQGDEAKFLGRLPLAALRPSDELLETLERWGIRRFQELAALPPLGIAERLGPEGLKVRELARGEAERKLAPVPDPLCFEDEIELEYPVELLEPLAFLLARLANGLATRLAARGLATDELRLRLGLPDRSTHERALRLPVPSLDTKAFLKLLELDLEAHPPAAPVVRVWMGMNPVKPRAAQAGLYVPAAPEPVKLELTLARIRAIVGQERAGYVELLDTHRPEGFRMAARINLGRPPAYARGSDQSRDREGAPMDLRPTQRYEDAPLSGRMYPAPTVVVGAGHARPALDRYRVFNGAVHTAGFRRFRPARAARVELADGQPCSVSAGGVRGRVLDYAGPWRGSGDWWTADAWQRDEWDIALSDGVFYRLYCSPKGWFVEGEYD